MLQCAHPRAVLGLFGVPWGVPDHLSSPESDGVVVFNLEGMLDQAKLAITKAMFRS